MARRWLSLASLLLFPFASGSAYSDSPLECAAPIGDSKEECQQTLKPVTTVIPGSLYVAKLPCLDCAVRSEDGVLQQKKNELVSLRLFSFWGIQQEDGS
jgi:hypothetical protein